MKKKLICSVCVCLVVSLLATMNIINATDFEGQENTYTALCASATLSNSDKDVCTDFNAYLKEQNAKLKTAIKDTKSLVADTAASISEVEAQLTLLNDEIVAKEAEVAYLDSSIANLVASINEREGEVKDRMYAMQSYMNNNSYVSFIFGADNFADMLSRMDSINELTAYDKELVAALQRDTQAVEDQKTIIFEAKGNLEEQKQNQQTLQTQYQTLLNEQSDLLSTQQSDSVELEKASKEVDAALADLASRSKVTEIKETPSISGDSEIGKAIATAALTKRGSKYTWGATGPNTFDCSGLVYWAYNQAGVGIGRTTASGYSSYGKSINISQAQAGDVVTFTGYGYVCHIGIFIDNNGTVVHAAGQANEINGQWGGTVRVNNVYDVGLSINNCRRMY